MQIEVPNIGDFEAVDVIEVLIKVGDVIKPEDPLVTLESEKATMDIPAPQGGRVTAVHVRVGDKVSQGKLIIEFEPEGISETALPTPTSDAPAPPPKEAPATLAPTGSSAPRTTPIYAFVSPDPGPRVETPPASSDALLQSGTPIYASPGLRKFARELGVDLKAVKGSGRKQRVMRDDVTVFVKQALHATPSAGRGSFTLPQAPAIDFSKFGAIESRPLSKIKKLTGQNLHRAWVSIPHVTQFDEADITELDAFRRSKSDELQAQGRKLTLVAFLLKAVTVVLHKYPDFNSSLAPDGESLIYKKYFHVGLAVNTERGLLVPVVRDVEQKTLLELAGEIQALSLKARDGKLTPGEMQGGCFTVSSLGGISGTGFTPIINPPEVAILGVSPSATKPVYREQTFVPRLMLPYALSYDHRVIDGVAAAEFTRHLSLVLGDIRHLLL
ncbi:MAG: biotin/lipoyl-binding protein [Gammaproteobacteria bacterium]|nr:biotin/lipoyl-binding protein [Gammaproteobacteria bacterium]